MDDMTNQALRRRCTRGRFMRALFRRDAGTTERRVVVHGIG
jgi:hypothetical protein